MKYRIEYYDSQGSLITISFDDIELARSYMANIFMKATLFNASGKVVGGIRPVEESEKKSKNHKWQRWIDFDLIEKKEVKNVNGGSNDFMDELENLDE